MRTALIVLDTAACDHLIVTDDGTTPYVDFLSKVRAAVIKSGAHPLKLIALHGRQTGGLAEGRRECYSVMDAKLGLWDGSMFIAGRTGAAYFSDYNDAEEAAAQVPVPVKVRALPDNELPDCRPMQVATSKRTRRSK